MATQYYEGGQVLWTGSHAYHPNGQLAWNGHYAYYPDGNLAWNGSHIYYDNGQMAWNGEYSYRPDGSCGSFGLKEIEMSLGNNFVIKANKRSVSLFLEKKKLA